MGAYDGNPTSEIAYSRDSRSQWGNRNPPIDGAIDNLVDRFSGIGVSGNDPSKESLFQVMNAVEAAENMIKNQMDKNNHLRIELLRKTQELEKYKSDALSGLRSPADGSRDEHILGHYKAQPPVSAVGNEEERVRWVDHNSSLDPGGTLVIHQNILPKIEDLVLQNHVESQHYSESSKVNGTVKGLPGGQAGVDNAGLSQFSPSSRSFSPSRYQKEGEYDPKFGSSGHGLMQASEVNNSSNILKQDLVLKVREHEEEIVLLRKHLADYSMKEAQIRNEKYILEKRIAHMRMVFDQQQQDLVEATSKALSYRQEIIEENIRLTYALQAAQQERSTFVSSLLPLLVEYSLQPPVHDAQSIVSDLKVLFKHLQEKLIITEAKLKESQYQLAQCRSDVMNNSSFAPQSPSHSFGAALNTSNKSLEIVPQPTYAHTYTPISSPLNAQTTKADWEALGYHNHHIGGVATKNLDHENLGRSSPSASSNPAVQDRPAGPARHVLTQGDSHDVTRFGEANFNKHPSFNDLVSSNEMDDSDGVGLQNGREPSVHWGPGSSPYLAPAHDDPNSSFSPYLPPVLEEPSSSFSEAAEDDPLPAIEGLQITGDAFPGQELQACGYSTNGTTSCNFEWVRFFEDGSVNYIVGAKQPDYLVTADDVDSYLAIEVQPLDDRKRKGELVKVFANEQRKITCDSVMQEEIEKTLFIGHTSFEVSLSAGCLDIWEPAILAIKREGYSIKCNGPRGVVITEKFSPSIAVTIPCGQTAEFSIVSSGGPEYLLHTAESSSMRDTIVLAMRLFIMRAVEKRKKKKGLFFK
ncbi:uncharacterized protein LOC131237736 isoform X2 [Magnolia sinica]|uniref:uncharacterized protein LOC131237736 isoform X2 n=1 Tax=Magnolia sinica TaxID=86752 RepID=UPI00265B621D|nr:uncharacterized protein LOC131237736 isoform X2 [Magnolia sinica]